MALHDIVGKLDVACHFLYPGSLNFLWNASLGRLAINECIIETEIDFGFEELRKGKRDFCVDTPL